MVQSSVGDPIENSKPNVLVVVSKGMQAVKLCSNQMLQFLTGVPG